MRGIHIGKSCVIGVGLIVTHDAPNKVFCGIKKHYCSKQNEFEDTIGWNAYKKRRYLEQRFANPSK